MMYMAK